MRLNGVNGVTHTAMPTIKTVQSDAKVKVAVVFEMAHGIKICTVADLVAYRLKQETLVRRVAETILPTRFGDFKVIAYENSIDNRENLALVKGDIDGSQPMLVRVHSECMAVRSRTRLPRLRPSTDLPP